jgi:glutamate---cysteine ligase / carboxylate-amine ligase
VLEHDFTGPAFTVGIEEELMLLEADSLDLAQEIERILEAVPDELEGQVKPELLQSVLEIATKPHDSVSSAGEELRRLRRTLVDLCEDCGLLVAAVGTHPWAKWEEQLVVERPRYQELAQELAFIARRELIFGTHVHVGIDGPDRAIYVADGIRRYLPLMLALSSNSPFWRGHATGLMSSRVPVFRAFPRVGIPPHYGTWEVYSTRVELMMKAGAIEDYTYMWWDVRPHPNLGTVETRIFDQLTRVDDTIAVAALTVSLARRLTVAYDAGEPLTEYPTELVDDNKVRAAISGMEGVLMDFRAGRQEPAEASARRLMDELREHATELGCERELDGIERLLGGDTGARRQLRLYERNPDLHALMREVVATTRA